jgi:3-keto-disaccharide hydrolase
MAVMVADLGSIASDRFCRFLRRMSLFSLFLAVLGIPSVSAVSTQVWSFDDDPVNAAPGGFEIGTLFDGRSAGDWKVISTDKARSRKNVLAQLQDKGAEHAYKLLLINGSESADLELAVSFLAIDGKADMGGGLIWRARDDRNYYLARANPLEQNIRIYRVAKGVRHILQNFDHIIEVARWHTLRITARGCHLQVFYDDRPVFELCDSTFKEGKIGLWTKSDAVTYFDDLRLTMK